MQKREEKKSKSNQIQKQKLAGDIKLDHMFYNLTGW